MIPYDHFRCLLLCLEGIPSAPFSTDRSRSARSLSQRARNMASHEELVAELPKLEKMSNAQRQKHAKKRRKKQLVKWREWEQTAGEPYVPGGTLRMKERERLVHFDSGSHLNEAVMRNDLAEGK